MPRAPKIDPDWERFSSSLPRDLLARLRKRAKSEGKPMNYYLREGLSMLISSGRL